MEEGPPEQVRSEVQVLQPGVSLAPAQMVTDDRPCLVCGYNLKSLAVTAQCPECGTPVERSLRGILLKYSSPDYVTEMRRGILLVEVGLILEVVGGIVATGVAMFTQFSVIAGTVKAGRGAAPPAAFSAATQSSQLLQQIVGTVFGLMSLWGWWMFSTPDPALMNRDPGFGSRRLLRIFLAFSAASSLAGLILSMLPGVKGSLTPAGLSILTISVLGLIGLTGGVAHLVGFIASMTYMMHLARRIPDAKMGKQAEMYRWLLPVIYVAGSLVCVGPLVAFIMYLVQIDGWRRRMRDLGLAMAQEDLGASYGAGATLEGDSGR